MKRYGHLVFLVFTIISPKICLAAIDSYNFFHVTIETPYMIFLFLVGFILAPFFLMAILYWRFAFRKQQDKEDNDSVGPRQE